MAKHLSVLRRFEVYSEQEMRQATAHAKVCDGKPQPKPEPKPKPEGFRNSFVSDVWIQAIVAEYARRTLVEMPPAD